MRNDQEAYAPPPDLGPKALIQPLSWRAPFEWLWLGAADLRRAPAGGLFYGLCFWLMYWVLRLVFHSKPEYTMSVVSGCLLLGPFLATGLYDLSRQMQANPSHRHDLVSSIGAWEGHLKSMGMLVLMLLVLELLWGRASLVVFAIFFNTGLPSTTGVLEALFNPENLDFLLTYLAVGGGFAVLVFMVSVVSIPMILDRDTDAISAAITSLRVVAGNPAVILGWGALISGLLWVSMLAWGVGVWLLGPIIGHATWHAYKACVRWEEAPASSVISAAQNHPEKS